MNNSISKLRKVKEFAFSYDITTEWLLHTIKNYQAYPIILNSIKNTLTDYERNFIRQGMYKQYDRKEEEYVISLFIGWLIEDIVLYILKRRGYNAEHSALDLERGYSTSKRNNEADLVIIDGSKKHKIEVVSDLTGFIERNKRNNEYKINFRKIKGHNILKDIQAGNTSYTVIVDILHKNIYKVEMNQYTKMMEGIGFNNEKTFDLFFTKENRIEQKTLSFS